MGGHTFDPSTLQAEKGISVEFEDNLVHTVSSKPAKAIFKFFLLKKGRWVGTGDVTP